MRIICSICLEDMHDDSTWVAMTACGHIFDKNCIDLSISRRCIECPICKARPRIGLPYYGRIFPSKNDILDTEGCATLVKDLVEANQKSESLQKELANTKHKLTSVRQEHETVLSELGKSKESLEKTTKSLNKQKSDNDRMKRTNDDCFSRNDLLKSSNQILTTNLKKSQNLCQKLGEQLKIQESLNDVMSLSVSSSSSGCDSSCTNQAVTSKEYLELKRDYHNLVVREQLVEKKLIDFTLQMQDSQPAEETPKAQRVYKQLSEALARENKLLTTMTSIKLEKQYIFNEKRALHDKYLVTCLDIQRLQAAESEWLADNRNLQEKLKIAYENLTKMQLYANENESLKKKVQSLQEAAQQYQVNQ